MGWTEPRVARADRMRPRGDRYWWHGRASTDPTPRAPMPAVSASGWPSRTGPATPASTSTARRSTPSGPATRRTVPIRRFPARATTPGPTRVVALDLSDVLGTAVPGHGPVAAGPVPVHRRGRRPATSPPTPPARSSTAWRDAATPTSRDREARVGSPGRPATSSPCRAARRLGTRAEAGAVLYHVDDSPLLAYLGVEATEPRFAPTRLRRRAWPGPGWPRWPPTPTPPGAAVWRYSSATPATTRP